jgi:hypothetical protein
VILKFRTSEVKFDSHQSLSTCNLQPKMSDNQLNHKHFSKTSVYLLLAGFWGCICSLLYCSLIANLNPFLGLVGLTVLLILFILPVIYLRKQKLSWAFLALCVGLAVLFAYLSAVLLYFPAFDSPGRYYHKN